MKSPLTLGLALLLLMAPLGVVAMANPDFPDSQTNRLVIVDGATDQVLYDDGRDDLFCVTRLHHWRDDNGVRRRHRTMRCR
jgi:hypothetical protein